METKDRDKFDDLYPEHVKMRAQKKALRIDMVAETLERFAACGLSYEVVKANRALWEEFQARGQDVEALAAFFAWAKKRKLAPAHSLHPSADLFAEYAGINLLKIDAEKTAMLAYCAENAKG